MNASSTASSPPSLVDCTAIVTHPCHIGMGDMPPSAWLSLSLFPTTFVLQAGFSSYWFPPLMLAEEEEEEEEERKYLSGMNVWGTAESNATIRSPRPWRG